MFEYINSVSEKIRKNYHQGHHPLDVPDPEKPETLLRPFGYLNFVLFLGIALMLIHAFSDEKTPGEGYLFMLFVFAFHYLSCFEASCLKKP